MLLDPSHTLTTDNLLLRQIEPADATEAYTSWMNDPEVVRFTEARHHHQSIDTIRQFIEDICSSDHSLMLAICRRTDNTHIGNIKLGPIDTYNRRADIGIIIGLKSEWGKGFAAEAIACMTELAFTTFDLRKVYAGCYGNNIGSKKAFEKVGFKVEAEIPEYWWDKTGWTSEILLARKRHDGS